MARLIVNADDLGYTEGVTDGIVEAHARGIVTSTSLMVEGEDAVRAGVLTRSAPALSVGLHAVLDSGGELTVAPESSASELERQLGRFLELVGHAPTHVDSHHHVHRDSRLESAFARFAARHELPLRDHSLPHCGLFYGGASGETRPGRVDVEALLTILAGLESDVELGCHPGYSRDLDSSYTVERDEELRTLTDPRVRAAIDELGIELIGWGEL